MIEQFFRPDSVEQALELKRRYQDEAWLLCTSDAADGLSCGDCGGLSLM
ncbi:hypothetical protein KCA24_18600 [Escherichia coli]|nr:hypothetical protein [Escherichia coli]